MRKNSVIAVFLMLIVLTPIVCASIFAWNEYTNAYELTENVLDEEQDFSKKQPTIEKIISHSLFSVFASSEIALIFSSLKPVPYKIAIKVLTPPPK